MLDKPSSRYRLRSAFVPHDLPAPLHGAESGKLKGLTAAVKDIFDIEGYRTGFGSPDWYDAQRPAAAHSDAVRKILGQGATIVGKTVCDEFCFSVTGANPFYGTPLNPHAPDRLPTGSSSGSASAVAAGCCDFALGGDTGGSVRLPAASNGIYGLRPTFGRVDLTGVAVMASSFDCAGWFAGGPGVLRLVGEVLLGGRATPGDISGCLIAEDAFESADSDTAALLREMLALMQPDLPAMKGVRISPDGLDDWREIFRVVQAQDFWSKYGAFFTGRDVRMSEGVKQRVAYVSTVTAKDAANARRRMNDARDHVRGVVTPGKVLVLPTAPSVAPKLDVSESDLDHFRSRVMRLTSISGLSGLPQITLPAGTLHGAPVGLSFIGWAGSDEVLLDLACTLAKYMGGAPRN
jgi:amidase